MQWHLKVEKTPEGKFKAFSDSAPHITAVADEEHQAFTKVKEQLREAAVRGDI